MVELKTEANVSLYPRSVGHFFMFIWRMIFPPFILWESRGTHWDRYTGSAFVQEPVLWRGQGVTQCCLDNVFPPGVAKGTSESTPDLAKSVPPKEWSGQDMEEIRKHVVRTEISFDDEQATISANDKSERLQQSMENLCQNG